MMTRFLAQCGAVLFLAVAVPLTVAAQSQPAAEGAETVAEEMLYLDLEAGRVTIRLRPDLAPGHVARIKELVGEGFYDGLTFHRVIEGFMAQGGDPKGNGTGGTGQKLKAEFSAEKHIRGTVSMARSQDPNSGDSQFFIVFDAAPHLDGQYTIWGQVVDGMDYVDQLKKGAPWANGRVTDPDKILKMTLGEMD